MSLKKNYTTKERFAILEKVTTELYVAMHKLQLQINELQPKEIVKIGDEQTQLDFDDSMIYLDEYIKEISSIKDFAPIFIKMI